jgi:hypothetical protein
MRDTRYWMLDALRTKDLRSRVSLMGATLPNSVQKKLGSRFFKPKRKWGAYGETI